MRFTPRGLTGLASTKDFLMKKSLDHNSILIILFFINSTTQFQTAVTYNYSALLALTVHYFKIHNTTLQYGN
jgi:hypothetical protein